MYIVPPMDDEPPRDFVDFVAVHLADAQREAARLVGGPDHADEIYPAAFSDVAARWRRLRLHRRIRQWLGSGSEVAADMLYRRLALRAKQWREEQVFDVDVQVLRPMPVPALDRDIPTLALRKAAVLPETTRWQVRPLAEASIAWDHAWRQAQWRRIGRTVAVVLLVLIALAQIVPTAPD